ncbi:MAG: peptidase M15, partial [Treponema sp.]|nr:peptidase M15 [Treponema sp.]
MKKLLFALFCLCALCGCEKKVALAETNVAAQSKAAENQNPEVEKLRRVFAKMTDRCKEAIPNGNPEEFLADLHKVLEEEKSAHRSDDLDLLYLIDKKNSVGSDYVPKDLKPVKNNDLWNVSRNDLSLRPESYAALEELSRAALQD